MLEFDHILILHTWRMTGKRERPQHRDRGAKVHKGPSVRNQEMQKHSKS